MFRDTLRQVLVLVAALTTIVFNIAANILPLNGLNTGELSDRFEIFFVPAGYVFSIWGLIYLGLIAYAIYQVLPSQSKNPRLRSIGYIFILSCVANIAWLFLWHYEVFEFTLVAMLVLLFSLIAIYLRLDIGRSEVSTAEKWAVHLPFSIYLGWVTVATIANVTAFLNFINWNGFGISPEIWTFILLVVAVVVAGLMAYSRQDIAYLLVLIWAFVGIGVEQSDTPQVANAAYLAAVVVAIFVIIIIIQKFRQTRRPAMATS